MRKLSLTAKLLVVVLALSFAFTGVCAVTGFIAFNHAFIQAKEADLVLYAQERGRSQDSIFRNMTRSHQAAADVLTRPTLTSRSSTSLPGARLAMIGTSRIRG